MVEYKKIDIHAHAHAFPQYAVTSLVTKQRWVSDEEVIKFYDEIGVERGVLLCINSPEYHYDQLTNNEALYMVDKFPDRFLFFAGIDPRMAHNDATPKLGHIIEHYKNLGAKGVGELTAQMYIDDPYMDNLFDCCAEYDMPITIHIAPQFGGYYGIVDELGLPRLEKMLKKHKNTRIFGHSQCFWSEISADNTDEVRGRNPGGKIIDGTVARLLRECPNLYCDCSAGSGLNALSRDLDYTARFIEEFGDRMMFGLDICSPNNTHQYKHNDLIKTLREKGYMNDEQYYKFVRGNAIKQLKLHEIGITE